MVMKMDDETAAAIFSSLGNPARLALLRLLVKAGTEGLNVGQLQKHLDIPASTLAHHISHLVRAGTIKQERKGREVINVADFRKLGQVATFLVADCCAGVPLK